MRRKLMFLAVSALLSGCPGIVGGPTGGGAGGGSGGGAATGGGTGDGGAAETSGCAVEQLLATRCTQCHGAVPMNGAPVSLDSLAALRLPSQLDATKSNAERCLIRMSAPVARMPPEPEAAATADEIALLETWIAAGLPACPPTMQNDGGTGGGGGTTTPAEPNLIPQNELFMCTPGTQSDAPTRIRRLDRWQWTRNVGGAVTRSWTGFSFFDNPFDPSGGEPYSTWTTDETLDESMVEIFLPIVSEAGPPWAGPYTGSNRLERLRNDTSLRCMYQQNRPNAACVRHYLSEFLEHGVYFRPARTDELDRLQTFATAVITSEVTPDGGFDQDTRTRSITRISNAAWLTTGAMFREEMGDPAVDAGRVALTDWQLAQQLAYAVGSRAPGATPLWVFPDFSAPEEGHMADIADAARDGGIRNDAVVDQLYRKYAGGTDPTRFDLMMDWRQERRDARGEYWLGDGTMGFFREWLGYSNVASIFKERPEATSAFDDGGTSPYRPQLGSYGNLMDGYYGYESLLTQQLDDVIARVVANDQQVLRNLLTTRQWFLPANTNGGSSANAIQWTGQIYGTEVPINYTNAERWRMMPMLERAGVLTHPAWLGAHGGNFEDDPSIVHRGKWVRENLLCGWVPPLSSVMVQAMVGPHSNAKNARARLDEATAGQQCQGCHSLMNPLGYPFELYNHAGYLRTRDHAADGGWKPPDGTSVLSGLPDPMLNGPVRDGVEFSEKLADSPWVKRCFVRQTFRYFMGRAENRTDACTLSRMEQAYDSNNGSFHSMVSALMTSDTWKTRVNP
ncbi:MAG: DUF1588 domain-containing protein [Archangium sp.]|nr:DUF1588 domain-containing protein [Archangium sp.]